MMSQMEVDDLKKKIEKLKKQHVLPKVLDLVITKKRKLNEFQEDLQLFDNPLYVAPPNIEISKE